MQGNHGFKGSFSCGAKATEKNWFEGIMQMVLSADIFADYSNSVWIQSFNPIDLIRSAYDQSYRCSTLSFGSFHEQEFEIKSHSISLSELSDTIPQIIDNGLLKQEFASVFRGQLMKWDYGKQVQHRAKNRYGNLLPYDHSRVVLETIGSDENTDYINANYVDGYKCVNRYVATQGPLNNTITDFWRMVWQLDSHQIVMLTSLDEGGKVYYSDNSFIF